ncbi:MAG: glycogen/starch/alpha-glucan phosphorylase [Myxococcaceae bacterium]|nr:glycogen/starch/alpha-glucan phosphorylase [Myxococcaceae bacterium]
MDNQAAPVTGISAASTATSSSPTSAREKRGAPPAGAPTRIDPGQFRKAVLDHLLYTCVKDASEASTDDLYRALAHTVRDRLVQRWLSTQRIYLEADAKRVYYLSSEFLTGRSLGLCLLNLGLYQEAESFVNERGLDLPEVLESEGDPGLGNGGLGRLAACFMDSLATLELPAVGYGIRYDYGIFEQRIEGGQQVEHRDNWLHQGNPWELPRHEHQQVVRLYGHTETHKGVDGKSRTVWIEGKSVIGIPYDSFIAGHETENVNTLRLWAARAPYDFDLQLFNSGDYRRAVEEKVDVENISKVLYPPDHTDEGKELRLKQQYFFVACSLADIMRHFKRKHSDLRELPHKAAIQLNDTHPAIAVAELMRILIDQEGLEWDLAWEITQKCCGYTNHTLMPEALEKWPVRLFERVLPRHLEIIYGINHDFLRKVVTRWPGDLARMARMSIIDEGGGKQVRMAHLATVGSHSINGVARLHSELVKHELLRDFYELTPERFNNKTNGVTPRRWLLYANPRLSHLIAELLGPRFAAHELPELSRLTAYRDDPAVLERVRQIKLENKRDIVPLIEKLTGVKVDPTSMFVIQVKRIHEYKRQLLATLGIIADYLRLRDDPDAELLKRTYIFAGKAAAGYAAAKQHIRLINDVGQVINNDPLVRDRIKVVFIPNYGVSLAQAVIPAADISLQISLAGKEASGTGNMKFALSGAVTLGTLDGANVEIREAVGADHFLLFGMEVPEVQALHASGYDPRRYIAKSPELARVIDLLESGFFSFGDSDRYAAVVSYLRDADPYMICADFDAYMEAQARAGALYADRHKFAQTSLINTAGGGVFSSDDTIAAYASEIWNVKPVKLETKST